MDLDLIDTIIDIHGGFGCFNAAGSDNFLWEEQPC